MTLAGKPMIRWVHEAVMRCRTLDEVRVATDDERIRDCVEAFGGRVVMTSPAHRTGTDRLAEASADLAPEDVVVNVQGDEPLVEPGAVDAVAEALRADAGADLATLAARLDTPADLADPNVVKVVCDTEGRALYFSRAPIPWDREAAGVAPAPAALRHVGLYAYRRAFLERFVAWPPTPLETTEGLEQLRALEHGARIRVALTEHETIAVDSPRDVAAVEARLRERFATEAG